MRSMSVFLKGGTSQMKGADRLRQYCSTTWGGRYSTACGKAWRLWVGTLHKKGADRLKKYYRRALQVGQAVPKISAVRSCRRCLAGDKGEEGAHSAAGCAGP